MKVGDKVTWDEARQVMLKGGECRRTERQTPIKCDNDGFYVGVPTGLQVYMNENYFTATWVIDKLPPEPTPIPEHRVEMLKLQNLGRIKAAVMKNLHAKLVQIDVEGRNVRAVCDLDWKKVGNELYPPGWECKVFPDFDPKKHVIPTAEELLDEAMVNMDNLMQLYGYPQAAKWLEKVRGLRSGSE